MITWSQKHIKINIPNRVINERHTEPEGRQPQLSFCICSVLPNDHGKATEPLTQVSKEGVGIITNKVYFISKVLWLWEFELDPIRLNTHPPLKNIMN